MSIFSIAALNTGIRNRKQAEINSKQKKEERSWKHFNCTFFIPTGLFQSWPVFLTKFFMKEIWVRVAAHIVVHSCHDQCLKNISVVFFEFSLYFHNHYIVLDICNISIHYSVFKKVSRDRKHCNSNLFNIPGNSTSLLKPKICLRWVSEVLKYMFFRLSECTDLIVK